MIKIKINVGIMPYVYGEMYNKLGIIKKDNNKYDYLEHNDTKEKSFVFYVICTNLLKRKSITNYKSINSSKNLCEQIGISYRSYIRYIDYMLINNFAYIDKSNKNILKLCNAHDMFENINTKLKNDRVKTLLRHDIAIFECKLNFKFIQLALRYVCIKYDEEKRKKRIIDNISLNKTDNNSFLLFYNKHVHNNSINKKSRSFDNLYTYIYLKTRNKNTLSLYEQLIYTDDSVVKNDKNNNILIPDKFGIISKRMEVRKNNNKIPKDDKVIDMLLSKNIDNIESNIESNMTITKNTYGVDGSIYASGSIYKNILMWYDEYNYLSRLSILTPLQYYKLLSCNFILSYRSGYKKLGSNMSLSKSQISRIIKSMSDSNITKVTKRYVDISSVNSKNPRELINNLNTQYSMIYENNENLKSKSFDRLIFCYGSILYEIESDKKNMIDIQFNLLDDCDKKFFDGDIIHTKKYMNISKKIFGDDIILSKHKYSKAMQQINYR